MNATEYTVAPARGPSQFLRREPNHPKVLEYLHAHGFTPAQAVQLHWREATPEGIRRALGLHPNQVAGADIALLMPCFEVDGALDHTYNRAILFPTATAFDDGARYRKLSPSGKKAANRAMFLPGCDYRNAKVILWCESLPKAAFVHMRFGIAAAGLNGVDGWSPDDFANLPRDAEHIFLSDSLRPKSARNIELSAMRLSKSLPNFKWTHPPRPPASWHKEDWGIDDCVLHAGEHGTWEFKQILASARPLVLATEQITCTPAAEIVHREAAGWIVKNLIPAGELVTIVGPTNCGKTFLTMDLLLAVARGLPHWHGERVKRHGTVVHITLEGGGLPNRVRSYMKRHDLKDSDVANYVAIETPINLRATEQADAIIAAASKLPGPIALIAVDTVNRALGGGDENSSTDMGALLANAELIKAAFPNSAVLLVHHLGKDAGKGARGHSSLTCNVGAELHVVSDEASGIRTVSVEKQRDGTTNTRFNFELKVVSVGHDDDGDEITSCVVAPSIPPVTEKDMPERDIYEQMRACWLQNLGGAPVSHDTLWKDSALFKPAGSKLTRDVLSRVFKLAIAHGWAVEANAGVKHGKRYVLSPAATAKYAGG